VDRSRPPAPGVVRPFRFPPFERHRVASGLTVLAARVDATPLVHLQVLTPAGAQYDPRQRAGLATLTASLLDDGTALYTASEIAARVEGLGGNLTTGAGWDSAAAVVELGSSHLGAGLELLAEVAARPTFPDGELERVRQRRLGELVRRRDQPDVQADLWFARSLYGDALPYGYSLFGDDETVARIARDDVVDFYRRHYPAAGSVLIAVGDLDPAALPAAAEAFAGKAAAAGPPTSDLGAPPPPAARAVVVDRPGAAQTELRLGQASVPRKHPDFVRLKVMNSLLGGKFTSRLNLNLRERHGYTYSVFSAFAGRLGPGPFVVSSAVTTAATGAAAREILGEIRRLRSEPVGEAELADAKSYLVGTFPFTVQSLSGLAVRLEELATYDLPDDHFDRYPGEVAAVGQEDVQRVAAEHLDPERMTLVAAGPAAELAPQLADFGPLEVVDPI
jgi:zinc protease